MKVKQGYLLDQEKVAECPECGATYPYVSTSKFIYCGVCAGDVGRDVRVIVRQRKPNEQPEFN